jgi:hypothetical protein
MNTAEKLMVGFGAGAGAAMLFAGIMEGTQDFNPAEHVRHQVDACAKKLPTEAKTYSVATVPKPCARFGEYETANALGEYMYHMPSQQQFVGEQSPDEDYNIEQFKGDLEAALVWGVGGLLIAYVVTIAGASDEKHHSKAKSTVSQQPDSRPIHEISLRTYRRKYAKEANKQMPENMAQADYYRFLYSSAVRPQTSLSEE